MNEYLIQLTNPITDNVETVKLVQATGPDWFTALEDTMMEVDNLVYGTGEVLEQNGRPFNSTIYV